MTFFRERTSTYGSMIAYQGQAVRLRVHLGDFPDEQPLGENAAPPRGHHDVPDGGAGRFLQRVQP